MLLMAVTRQRRRAGPGGDGAGAECCCVIESVGCNGRVVMTEHCIFLSCCFVFVDCGSCAVCVRVFPPLLFLLPGLSVSWGFWLFKLAGLVMIMSVLPVPL